MRSLRVLLTLLAAFLVMATPIIQMLSLSAASNHNADSVALMTIFALMVGGTLVVASLFGPVAHRLESLGFIYMPQRNRHTSISWWHMVGAKVRVGYIGIIRVLYYVHKSVYVAAPARKQTGLDVRRHAPILTGSIPHPAPG